MDLNQTPNKNITQLKSLLKRLLNILHAKCNTFLLQFGGECVGVVYMVTALLFSFDHHGFFCQMGTSSLACLIIV